MKRRNRSNSASNRPVVPLGKDTPRDGEPSAAPQKRSARAPIERTRWLAAFLGAALLLAVALTFGQTLTYGFVDFDDCVYVYENPELARGLSPAGIAWAFTATRCTNWHPLTWLSYLLDHQVYGLEPWGYHLSNVCCTPPPPSCCCWFFGG
jgi:hypothetical protein